MSDDDNEEEVRVDKASLEYQEQFDLPPDEILIDTFMCALQKGILHQGRLYVSQHYLCFYSNILLSEAKLVIRADRIESVQLAKVLIFPTAIRVTHDGGVESLFASFLAREKCYNFLLQISRGEQIGKQPVKTSRELDKAMIRDSNKSAPNLQRTPTYLDQSSKHQKLLAKKSGASSATASPAAAASSSFKHRPNTDDSSDLTLSKFSRPKRASSSDEELSRTPAKEPQPESILAKIGSMLTSVHVSQAPRARENVISTPHGVVVLSSDPRAVLPTGAKFKHVRTGSLVPGGLDGPQVAVVAGAEREYDHSPIQPRKSANGRSASSSPMPGGTPAARKARNGRGREEEEEEEEEEVDSEEEVRARRAAKKKERDRERAARDTKDSSRSASASPSPAPKSTSSQKAVALAMKPRRGAPKKVKRREEEEEEEDD